MNTTERTIVYALLATLALGHAILFLSRSGRAAHAVPLPAGMELGPADVLRLAGDADGELVLRNRAGRLSWGQHEGASAYGVGFVHVGRVLRPLMDGSAFVEERQALEEELAETDAELQARWEAFREEHEDVTPDHPRFQEIGREYAALEREVREWNAEKVRRRGVLGAAQIERAYREIVAAVDIVASERDLDIVYRILPTDEPFDAGSIQQAYSAIMARSLLRYPEPLEITSAVMEELAIR